MFFPLLGSSVTTTASDYSLRRVAKHLNMAQQVISAAAQQRVLELYTVLGSWQLGELPQERQPQQLRPVLWVEGRRCSI